MSNRISVFFKKEALVPISIVALIAMMVLPIPTLLLDILFTFSIALSLLILLASIYTQRPLDFGVFPTVLLFGTLFRLALNIASTRVVLLNGHEGGHAAGNVIESFGAVVIGGNYAVGLVVFTILVIINFVVITKGAGRVSEVSARFTLDAMPGKQMSIDADLNAGVLTQEEAKKARKEVSLEADFYGSMDGASKFVRGDAIAGILVLIINLIGGIAIGMLQHDLGFEIAARNYALLTIGDGLVAQIPSLLISTAAAIMVTRVASDEDIGSEIIDQLSFNSKPFYISALVLGLFGIVPGMPHIAFISLAVVLFLVARGIDGDNVLDKIFDNSKTPSSDKINSPGDKVSTGNDSNADDEPVNGQIKDKELTWDDVQEIDDIKLEIGYKLISLVDESTSGELMKRIKGVRRKISQELGFLIPTIHICDDINLPPNNYRISISGVTSAEDKVFPDKEMAIDPGGVLDELSNSTKAKDPSFGLDAYWIDKSDKQNAQTLGYTVVDPSTVLATHLSQVINKNAYKLLRHEQTNKMLDKLKENSSVLVEELTPKTLAPVVIVKVLQNLLREQVPIKDFKTIVEILADFGQKTQDPLLLTEAVRSGLGPMIIQQINGFSQELSVITFEPGLEQILQKSLEAGSQGDIVIEPSLAEKLQQSIAQCAEKQEIDGNPMVLLVSSQIRAFVSKFARSIVSDLSVLSYQEVPDDKQIRVVGTIGSS
ncbi:MAG: flagellar biosynthesis protein FlhA [Francisellaceae bacterium]|jgi:flagellar biosynthesis protein FlhA|nr:flagellar biosynthesis protein FlhA [Francisellaceae bacterium]MBT6207632.1 flagellar biosynthesis protein FlhA [Francisellaceae bacterium]MBT6539666.1 flagellar biosynthesis protein FlhA [Francisellaceae bacterium]